MCADRTLRGVEPPEFHIGPFDPGRLQPSTNGHGKRKRKLVPTRAAVWRVTAGALLGSIVALSIVPRIHFLNLALFNPWVRPVIAAGVGGLVAGLTRRSGRLAAALAGAAGGVFGLWLAYLVTRSQVRVLFVERSASRVLLADLGRLAAYGVIPGALGGLAGGLARIGRRTREMSPITEL